MYYFFFDSNYLLSLPFAPFINLYFVSLVPVDHFSEESFEMYKT